MLLALDVGNTNITVGIFDGGSLRATWRLEPDPRRPGDEYAAFLLQLLATAEIGTGEITDAVVGSVVPELAPVFDHLCQRYFGIKPLVVGPGVKTGVRILYENPREVGVDRIADVVAALKRYGPPPLVIVDLGTGTVFDAVDANGDYLGGAIAPGIGIASEALFEKAAKLYRVELERPKAAIGRNTVGAIQSGVFLGYLELVEGMVRRFRSELGGQATVIGTGGWAQRLAQETAVFDHVDADLTLEGLRLIHEANR
jgi:type III pantothenate kinase